MIRILAIAAALAALASPSQAQTANASPTSGAGGGAGNVARTAPSGGTAMPSAGQPQIGAPTPLEEHEEHKSEKVTGSVCKGC